MSSPAEESAKCVSVARQAITNGDLAKAERFLEKALRLDESCVEAKQLIERVKNGTATGGDFSTKSSSTQNGKAAPSAGQSRTASESSQPQEPPNYSKEDVDRCKAVIAKKDYYEILGLTNKSASDDEIKKAYRKLALKFHPDKNRAPNATDAFKKISTAFACLSNPEKRKIYDEHGTEEGFNQRYQQHFREDQFDADDIFRMFFGGGGADIFFGGPGGGRRYYTRGGQAQRQYRQPQEGERGPENPGLRMLQQLFPLLLILILSGVLNFGGSGSTQVSENSYNFSYQQNGYYHIQVMTYRLQKYYFVTDRTAHDLRMDGGLKKRLDERVERDIMKRTEAKCDEAKRTRSQYINLSKKYDSNSNYYDDLITKAENVDMSSCQDLKDFRKLIGVQ